MVWNTVRSSWKPSGRLPSTRRSRLILASARTRAWRVVLMWGSFVVGEQREDVVPAQPRAAAEEGYPPHEPQPPPPPPDAPAHPRRSRRRPAGSQQVVHDQHPAARAHGVLVHLQRVRAVLQIVG